MPAIEIVFFQEDDRSVPLIDWLSGLPDKARAKCIVLIELLKQFGPELRRPHADYLRNGIYELRTHVGHVQYRMLYFYTGQTAVVSHGFIKAKAQVPPREIDAAVRRKEMLELAPRQYIFREE